MKLREYQIEALDRILDDLIIQDTALCALPTGSGKTEVTIGLIQKALEMKPDLKIYVLMGKVDLVTQTDRRYRSVFGGKVGVYCGSLQRKELSRQITIVSIQSTAQTRLFSPGNLIIIDEVHRLDQEKGAYLKFIEHQQSFHQKLKIVGFTATPFRQDGAIYGESKLFKKVSYRKTILEMIMMGFLCEPKMRGSAEAFDISSLRIRAGEYRQEDVDELVKNQAKITEQVNDVLSKTKDRKCIVWACANIDHCNLIADEIAKTDAFGVTTIHSQLDRPTRNANLSAFLSGSVKHMVFVSILSEGFDHPPIDCVVLMRPTRSPVLYVQTCGRGLRISPDKKDCLILDYGQVVKTLGPLDDPYIKGKSKGTGEAILKECPSCFSYIASGLRACTECGHVFVFKKPEEKLDKKAEVAAPLLSSQIVPETLVREYAFLEMYTSKSGNECVKITYTNDSEDKSTSLVWNGRWGITEFFVVSNGWAMQRLERRLHDLDVNIPGIPFTGEIECKGDFEIVKSKDGRYDRIISVKRIESKSPGTALGGWDEVIESNDSLL